MSKTNSAGSRAWRARFSCGAIALICACGLLVDLSGASYHEVTTLFGSVRGAAYIAAEVLCSLPARDEALLFMLLAALLALLFNRVYGCRSGAAIRAAGGRAAWVLAGLMALAFTFGASFDAVGSSALVTGGIAQAIRGTLRFAGWLVPAHVAFCALFWALDAVSGMHGIPSVSVDDPDKAGDPGDPGDAGAADEADKATMAAEVAEAVEAGKSTMAAEVAEACERHRHAGTLHPRATRAHGEARTAAALGAVPATFAGRLRFWLRSCARLVLDEHPFAGAALVLALLWLPVLVGYAPALFMWDTDTQILQWFGLPNHISSSVELIDPAVLITQHHPPLHTALVGLCVQAGMALAGNENVGIFLYALFQWAIDIAAIAWAMSLLKTMDVPRAARMAALAFIAVVPAFSNYSVLVTKDVLFAAALLVFAMELGYLVWMSRRGRPARAGEPGVPGGCGEPVRAKGSRAMGGCAGSPQTSGELQTAAARGERARAKRTRAQSARRAIPANHLIILIISALGVATLRSGMVVAVIAAAGAALVLAPGYRRYAAAALIAAVVLSIALTRVVYPALHITPGSAREMLSIPFQQVARFMRDDPERVTREDFQAIDAVLDARAIARLYDPEKSDPVKATFKEAATRDDLARFWGVWARWLAEDPGCFITATAANYYGYFFPGHVMTWSYSSYFSSVAMANTETDLTRSDIASYFSFSYPDVPALRALDTFCSMYRSFFQRFPVTSLTMQAAFYDWALLIATVYAATRRRPLTAPLLAGGWIVLLIALTGPCNATTYFRYAYPVALLAPFFLALLASARPQNHRVQGGAACLHAHR